MNAHCELRDDDPLAWSSIVVTGPQSEPFLQGQLSQDLTTLAPGGRWALLLAPDSTVITSCHVTSLDDGFALALATEVGEEALTRLRRFVLRTKCTLELVDGATGPWTTQGERVDAGRPWTSEFALGVTPHTFGPTFIEETVSFTKGCFTGQELVGRLDARGSSVPWRLVRAAGPSFERVDEVIRSKGPSGPQGFTSALRRGDLVTGLALAHRTLLGSNSLVDAPDVEVEPIS